VYFYRPPVDIIVPQQWWTAAQLLQSGECFDLGRLPSLRIFLEWRILFIEMRDEL